MWDETVVGYLGRDRFTVPNFCIERLRLLLKRVNKPFGNSLAEYPKVASLISAFTTRY